MVEGAESAYKTDGNELTAYEMPIIKEEEVVK